MMNPSSTSAHGAPADHKKNASGLGDGRQRFLSQVVAQALESGLRSPKDFIRYFSPKAIMMALASQPRLRANIVVPTIGLNEKVALKKSAESAGEDLQIALNEGVIDEDAIVRLFDPDDRVRYLDEKRLWAFVVEGDFWKATPAHAGDASVAKRNVAFVVDCARANGLITDHDIVEGLTLDRILEALPKTELARLVRAAVAGGRNGQHFDDEALLGAMPPSALLDHVPLSQMWDAVVLARIATPHGFAARGPSESISDDEEVVVEIVEGETGTGKAPARAGRSRRIDAMDLSELKGDLGSGNAPKN